MVLDYSLKTPGERVALVERVLDETPSPDGKYLSAMADYLLFAQDPGQTRRERAHEAPIVTRNRQVTASKRQTSLEGLVDQLENGEDGLYALMADGPQLLDARDLITDEDLESVPMMREMRLMIDDMSAQFERATGQRRYQLKKGIIETWQQMYLLKASFKGAWASSRVRRQVQAIGRTSLDENVTLGEDMMPVSDCVVSLYNPAHVSFLLTYWWHLKSETYDDLSSDMRWALLDLESLLSSALRGKPELRDIAVAKMRGVPSSELVGAINSRYGTHHSEQYLSTLWRRVIPRMVADEAARHHLMWLWSTDPSKPWKLCATCGWLKPRHPLWFPRNSSSDGYYSKCKCCRSKSKAAR